MRSKNISSDMAFDAMSRLQEMHVTDEEDEQAIEVAVVLLQRLIKGHEKDKQTYRGKYDKVNRHEYYEKNKERLAEYRRAYIEENREHIRERQRKYYAEHREQRRETWQKYYEKNKEHIKARQREYYRKNLAKPSAEEFAEETGA